MAAFQFSRSTLILYSRASLPKWPNTPILCKCSGMLPSYRRKSSLQSSSGVKNIFSEDKTLPLPSGTEVSSMRVVSSCDHHVERNLTMRTLSGDPGEANDKAARAEFVAQ